jgi:uncharacterized protein YegP (UPF0339 family)
MEKGVYEIEKYEDKAGKWRFKVVAPNGQIVEDSHQGFSSKQALEENMDLNARIWHAYYLKLYGNEDQK